MEKAIASDGPTPIRVERTRAADAPRDEPAPGNGADARQLARLEKTAELLRRRSSRILAMIHYGSSNGLATSIDPAASEVFDRLADGGTMPPMVELIGAHHALKQLVAPATPAGVRIYCQMRTGRARLLGPHATIRRLSTANILFMLLFFVTSASTLINADTIRLSVYEQSGAPLVFKLLFITAVSGIGAGFAVLFEAWEDIRRRRFDPVMESSYWCRSGLGVVAGLILTEIVQTGAEGATEGSFKGPLVALAGGFSAGLLHVVLSRVVKAIRNIFEPAETK
ncbi:MAG: hypothetical protein U1E59_20095 [Amaricoccus sp.]